MPPVTKPSPDSSSASAQPTDLGGLFDVDSIRKPIVDESSRPVIGSDGQPWYIELAGPSHPKTVEARNKAIRKVLKERRKKRAALDDVTDAEIEEVQSSQLDPLVMRTLGWGPINVKGAPFEFSAHNATQMYKTSSIIRAQIEEAFKEETAFLGKFQKP